MRVRSGHRVAEEVMRCHTYHGVHIPGCWGCSVYDHSYCTCKTTWPAGRRIDALEKRIKQLEKTVKALTEIKRETK